MIKKYASIQNGYKKILYMTMTPPASGLGTIVHVMVEMHIISSFSMSVNLFQFCKFILSFWEDRIPTARFKMNNQQGPTV